ncbi:MAG: hypothetical protein IPG64_02165 [Haliea sp.]|nr:hypothetical protein [Haliea sp.]
MSDFGAEVALYDSCASRDLVVLGNELVLDETTILKCGRLMENHNLGEHLFVLINVYIEE